LAVIHDPSTGILQSEVFGGKVWPFGNASPKLLLSHSTFTAIIHMWLIIRTSIPEPCLQFAMMKVTFSTLQHLLTWTKIRMMPFPAHVPIPLTQVNSLHELKDLIM